jgi:hypothetical protein
MICENGELRDSQLLLGWQLLKLSDQDSAIAKDSDTAWS